MTGDEFEQLKVFMDDRFSSQERVITGRIDNIDRLVNAHHVSLYGNGSAGLKVKVDRIETTHKTLHRVLMFVSAGVITVATWLGVNQ